MRPPKQPINAHLSGSTLAVLHGSATAGIAVSLFDVDDLTTPTRTHSSASITAALERSGILLGIERPPVG